MNTEDVLVSVPTRGAIRWATVERLQEIRDAAPGLPPVVYQPGNLSVALTRNLIVKRFLAGPWQWLFMVDDDVTPPPNMLDLLDCMDGYAMLAIPHPMPAPTDLGLIGLTVFRSQWGQIVATDIREGVHECDVVATGCVLIRREALERLGPAPFRIAHDPAAPILSDDFLFCDDLREAGMKIGYACGPGWFCDHQTTVSLAPILQRQMQTSSERSLP